MVFGDNICTLKQLILYFFTLNHTYFSPCSVSFVLIGEYIQNSPLNNFRLLIPSNIHLQCLCSTKNEKKTTSRRQYGNKNYFYTDSLTRPGNVKNKYVILRHLGDINHVSPRCLKITYTYKLEGTQRLHTTASKLSYVSYTQWCNAHITLITHRH
jgi:hypothetical protein